MTEPTNNNDVSLKKEKSSKKKKEKKLKDKSIQEKKRKRLEDEEDDYDDDNNNVDIADKTNNEKEENPKDKKKISKEERKLKKARKKAEKAELLDKIPKVDEDGIAYTKIQIKRMVKRVKRGLDPVPTEQEERERARQIRLEKQEEENDLAGSDNEQSESDEEGQDEEDNKMPNDSADAKEGVSKDDEDLSESKSQPLKKKKRSKAVPSDYTCMACKNKHAPLHWIYDCPDKVYKPGTNQVKKRKRGIHDPSSQKVFVSGLPFDVNNKDVTAYFEKQMKCGTVVDCKLLLFEDTKRCKGTGFVTFDSDEGAKKAMALNGTVLDFPKKKDEDKKKDKGAGKPQKELTLFVKKVLNRTMTKATGKKIHH